MTLTLPRINFTDDPLLLCWARITGHQVEFSVTTRLNAFIVSFVFNLSQCLKQSSWHIFAEWQKHGWMDGWWVGKQAESENRYSQILCCQIRLKKWHLRMKETCCQNSLFSFIYFYSFGQNKNKTILHKCW